MKFVHTMRFATRVERSAQIVFLLAGALLFTGCALGPKYKLPRSSLRLRTRRWGTGRLRNRMIRAWAEAGGRYFTIPN